MKVNKAEYERVNGDKEDASTIKAAIKRHKALKYKNKTVSV
tara:strand:- start:139 stop:261 length:123 start_codon:yes stop_codon:yes gene_type:complete